MAAAQRIRELRLEKELTQSQLARLLGVEAITVSRWELDEAHPSPLNQVRLARVLGVNAREFVDDTNEAVA